MKKFSRLSYVAAAGSALALLPSGCGGSSNSSSSSSAASTDQVMNVYGCEPQNPLIPSNTNEVCGGNPIDLMFAKLVTFDTKGNVKNEVAKSITANADKTVYTIVLKSGWKFTDGTPVTSESFTKAWSYAADATNAQVSASFFSNIKGYDELQAKGTASDAQLSGLKVNSDTEFTVTLNAASSVIPHNGGIHGLCAAADILLQGSQGLR